MTSYYALLNKLETFFNAHIQVKKFGGEFREQMPNFSTMDERYPLVYVVPTSETSGMNTNQFTIDVYCVDIIQKDRANINTILSDTQLILNDLYLYYTDGNDLSIDIISDPSMTPLNNFDLDYVAGWVGSFTFEVNQYSVCEIPIEPITPSTPQCDCDPATAELVNTEGLLLLTEEIDCGTTEQIIAPDGLAKIKLTGDGTLVNLQVPSGGVIEYDIPDNEITVNGVDLFTIDATEPLDILLRDQNNNVINATSVTHNPNQDHVHIEINTSSFSSVGATLMKTGQTTSYRTGDDGDIEAGRAVDFFTLATNNPFGNTNRFTDELGGQTYTNNIVIDWSTYDGTNVLGWYRVPNAINVAWNTAVDGALTISTGSYTTGWRLPNIMEFCSIMNWGLTSQLSYAPFTLGGFAFQTSTTMGFTTTNNFTINSTGLPGVSIKTNASGRYIGVRNFTVTGTTLT